MIIFKHYHMTHQFRSSESADHKAMQHPHQASKRILVDTSNILITSSANGMSFRREKMDKAHHVSELSVSGSMLHLVVDGKAYEVDLAKESPRLAQATQAQREHIEVSPSGYGLHWPAVDEDLSVDGLIGVVHHGPLLVNNS
jgi:hypothetical protein